MLVAAPAGARQGHPRAGDSGAVAPGGGGSGAAVPSGGSGAGGSGGTSTPDPLTTPWTAEVNPAAPLPDYPRPQMARAAWENLNGEWQFRAAQPMDTPPFGLRLGGRILVPYPVGSPLSGVSTPDNAGWYRREFSVPSAWRGEHVLLNFGGVAWDAKVWVNGELAVEHRGTYDGFSADVTAMLHPGLNELIVGYVDPVGARGEPVGKQVATGPYGYHHTASRGIWQTVWLEPVAPVHVNTLELVPDVKHGQVLVTPAVVGPARGAQVVAKVLTATGRPVAEVTAPLSERALAVPVPRARLWSPADPYLYKLRVKLLLGGRVVDSVSSYFGMRSIALGRVHGITRILLNGHFLFQSGALDQGYWPDGLYTPPTDTALRDDIARAQEMGFNMLREHVKVQPDRFYYWADRMGMLVWQDMPNLPLPGHPTDSRTVRGEFVRELKAVVSQLRSHPSIVTWVPFNEGWGEFDRGMVAGVVHALDPTRLVDLDSGTASCCQGEVPAGEIRDTHVYFGPFGVAPDYRASVIGEFGGVLPVPPAADRYPATPTSIGSPVAQWSAVDITALISDQYADLASEVAHGGVSAAVFTELNATEQELGLVTYDRRRFVVDPSLMRYLNTIAIEAGESSAADRASGQSAVPGGQSWWWPLNEGTGSTASEHGGGPALTLQGGAGWSHGVSGDALSFDGAGQQAATAGPVVDTGGSFSVSAWLSTRQAQQSASAVSQQGPNGSVFSLGIAYLGSNPDPAKRKSVWAFSVAGPGCGSPACRTSASLFYADARFTPRLGAWSYVTGVYDQAAKTITIYANGLAEDVQHVNGPVAGSGGPLVVGAGKGDYAGSDAFNGAVDELRLYPRVLSPEDVWQLYRASRPPSGSRTGGAVAATGGGSAATGGGSAARGGGSAATGGGSTATGG